MATVLLKSTFCATLKCDYTITQDIVTNKSVIALSMYVTPAKGYTIGPWTDGSGSYLGDSTSDTFTKSISNIDSKTVLRNTSVTVNHKDDGTGKVTIYWKWGVNSSWGGYVRPSGSFEIELPTIPRKATISSIKCSTSYLSGSITVGYDCKSTAFTHYVRYYVNGTTIYRNTIAPTATGANTATHSFNADQLASIYALVPNSSKATVNAIIETYNGSTKIGESSPLSIDLTIPTNVIPSINAITVSDGNGYASTFGGFVQNKSTAKVVVSASGVHGSTIKSYKTTVDGTSYTGSSFTSYALKNTGTLTITTTVTDSRGRSASKSTTITVYEYFNPKITVFTVARCLSDGTLSDEGTYVKCTYTYAIAPVNNKNTKTIKIQYLNGSTWTDLTSATAYSVTNATYTSTVTFKADASHKIRLYIVDYFNSSGVSVERTLSTVFTLINFGADGKSIAFGKVSESYPFDVDMLALFRKGFRCYPISNPISSTAGDTVDAWNNLGNSVHYYNTSGCLIDQPNQYGVLMNFTNNQKNIHQLWLSQPNGVIYHRGGNANGWSGTWKPLLDSNNYSSYALPLSGGTITGALTVNGSGNVNAVALTVGGIVDFLSSIRLKNGFQIKMAESSGTFRDVMYLGTSNNLIIGYGVSGNTNIYSGGGAVQLFTSKDRVALRNSTEDAYNAHFVPGTNAKVTLGMASYRWHSVYSANATIQTSDEREKENIISLGESPIATYGLRNTGESIDIHSELFNRLRPVQYNFINGNGRICYGLIAQEVLSAMEDLGINEGDLDLVHHEEWIDEETGEEKDAYGIAYANVIALNTHMIQKQQEEINDLKNEIAQLKELINTLIKDA